jgi:hypothetical protein
MVDSKDIAKELTTMVYFDDAIRKKLQGKGKR